MVVEKGMTGVRPKELKPIRKRQPYIARNALQFLIKAGMFRNPHV